MNVYRLTRCPHCHKAHDVEMEVMLHGSKNVSTFLQRLEQLKVWNLAKAEFCDHCGEHLPCGCSKPTPQR